MQPKTRHVLGVAWLREAGVSIPVVMIAGNKFGLAYSQGASGKVERADHCLHLLPSNDPAWAQQPLRRLHKGSVIVLVPFRPAEMADPPKWSWGVYTNLWQQPPKRLTALHPAAEVGKCELMNQAVPLRGEWVHSVSHYGMPFSLFSIEGKEFLLLGCFSHIEDLCGCLSSSCNKGPSQPVRTWMIQDRRGSRRKEWKSSRFEPISRSAFFESPHLRK